MVKAKVYGLNSGVVLILGGLNSEVVFILMWSSFWGDLNSEVVLILGWS